MQKVVIASKNPVKVQSAKRAFNKVFPGMDFHFTGISAPSGVADQPASDEETLKGARNRAKHIRLSVPNADYWVGIEGGIGKDRHIMEAFAWVCIQSKAQEGKARTATFELPPGVIELINRGFELGHANDILFKKENSKQQSGAVGLLTKGLIDRTQYYEPAVILALIPFINQALYL